MIFAASIVYFDEKKSEEFKKAISAFPNAELREADFEKGKAVIIIEGENNEDIESVRKELLKNDWVIDIAHHAFHFGEEVEKAERGEIIPDIDINGAFKRRRKE